MTNILIRFTSFIVLFSIYVHANNGLLNEAQTLYSKRNFEGAIRIYLSVLKQDPKSEKAHLGLIRSLWRNGDIQEVHKAAETALTLIQENTSLLSVMGDMLFRMARIPESQEAYTRAVSLDPLNARGHRGLGKIHYLNFNRKSAKAMIQKAYQCDPENPDIILDYARYLPRNERIPLLEEYLGLATYETEPKRDGIVEEIEFLKKPE